MSYNNMLPHTTIEKLLSYLGVTNIRLKDEYTYLENFKELDLKQLDYVLISNGIETTRSSFSDISSFFDEKFFIGILQNNSYVIINKDLSHLKFFDINFNPIKDLKKKEIKSILRFKRFEEQQNSLFSTGPNWFWKLFFKHKSNLLTIFALSFILSLIALIIPIFISLFYSQMIPSAEKSIHIELLFGVALLLLFSFNIRFFRSILINKTCSGLSDSIVRNVFRRILFLPPAFTEIAPISSQISRIRDFQSIKTFLSEYGSSTIYDLPFTIVLIIGMFYFAGSVAWVPVIAIIVFIIFGLIVYPSLKKYNDHLGQSNKDYQQFILELSSYHKEIKSFQGTDIWPDRFDFMIKNNLVSSHRSSMMYTFVNSFTTLTVNLSGLFTIVLGVKGVINGSMTSGELMASLVLVWRILGPVRNGFVTLFQVAKVKKSIEQLNRFMGLNQETYKQSLSSRELSLAGKIEYQGVSLRYNKEAPFALMNINLSIPNGSILGILGKGGAGKSSLIKVLMGLYPAQIGKIIISGKNINQYDTLSLRKKIGYLPQSPTLIPGTIATNLNTTTINKNYISKQIKTLNLDNFFNSIGNNIHTNTEDIPTVNSLFILKKLILLKISISKPDIIILDEPLRGLSRVEQDDILNWILDYKNSATMLIISNDPQVMQLTDKAVVMDKGRIKHQGHARDLINLFNERK